MAKLKQVTKLVQRSQTPAVTTGDDVPAGSAEVPAPRTADGLLSDPGLVVRTTIARELDLLPDDVTDEVHLLIDLGVDESQLPRLLNAMGEALDVRFPDDFFDGVTTVAQLSAAVRMSLGPL